MEHAHYLNILRALLAIKRKQMRFRLSSMIIISVCTIGFLHSLSTDMTGRLILSNEEFLFIGLFASLLLVAFISWIDLKTLQLQLLEALDRGIKLESRLNPPRHSLKNLHNQLITNPRSTSYCIWLYTLGVCYLTFISGLASIIHISKIGSVFSLSLIVITSVLVYTFGKLVYSTGKLYKHPPTSC